LVSIAKEVKERCILVAEARPWMRVDEEGDWVWVWIVGNGQRGMMISGFRRRAGPR
jgi:hypothetical protein